MMKGGLFSIRTCKYVFFLYNVSLEGRYYNHSDRQATPYKELQSLLALATKRGLKELSFITPPSTFDSPRRCGSEYIWDWMGRARSFCEESP